MEQLILSSASKDAQNISGFVISLVALVVFFFVKSDATAGNKVNPEYLSEMETILLPNENPGPDTAVSLRKEEYRCRSKLFFPSFPHPLFS